MQHFIEAFLESVQGDHGDQCKVTINTTLHATKDKKHCKPCFAEGMWGCTRHHPTDKDTRPAQS